jgi:hypothetical protein
MQAGSTLTLTGRCKVFATGDQRSAWRIIPSSSARPPARAPLWLTGRCDRLRWHESQPKDTSPKQPALPQMGSALCRRRPCSTTCGWRGSCRTPAVARHLPVPTWYQSSSRRQLRLRMPGISLHSPRPDKCRMFGSDLTGDGNKLGEVLYRFD